MGLKKLTSLLIIALLCLTCPSISETISFDDLVERDGLFYKKFSDESFSGTVEGISNGTLKKGIKNGFLTPTPLVIREYMSFFCLVLLLRGGPAGGPAIQQMHKLLFILSIL